MRRLLAFGLTFFVSVLYIQNGNAASLVFTDTRGDLGLYIATINTNLNAVNGSPLQKLGDQKSFARSMGNSAVFTNGVGTLYGFENYSLFTLSAGMGIGADVGGGVSYDPQKIGKQLSDDLIAEGDAAIGFSGIFAAEFGMNVSFLKSLFGLSNSLYLKVKAGGIPSRQIDEFSIKGGLFGVGFNYEFFQPIDLILVKWGGVSLGSGVYYHTLDSRAGFNLGVTQFNVAGLGGVTGQGDLVEFNNDAEFTIKSKIITVPVDLTTSVSFLYVLTLYGGVGVNFSAGKSDIGVGVNSKVMNGTAQLGTVSLTDATASNSPSPFQARVLAGLGVSILPVKLEIGASYYPGPETQGADVHVNVGLNW